MRIMSGIAIAGLVLGALIVGSTESLGDQAECGNRVIQVTVGENGKPVLTYQGGSADEVHACRGNTVRWVLNGPDRQYFVDFFSGAPFAGAKKIGSNGNVVSIVIGESAEKRAYDYGVNFADGGGIDPKIIVD
jgi:hypothetical protein